MLNRSRQRPAARSSVPISRLNLMTALPRAPTAAGRVHSDIERGFIRAEVMKYTELMAAGSEAALKAAGKMQVKGKDYIIEDGDICHVLFNV